MEFICRDADTSSFSKVIEVLCQESDPSAARQELQSQFDTVDQLYEELLNGLLFDCLLFDLSNQYQFCSLSLFTALHFERAEFF